MTSIDNSRLNRSSVLSQLSRLILSVTLLAVGVSASACGGHGSAAGHGDQYISRKVAQEEVENTLKNDARVDDFETDGDQLFVNVKESWATSPPGIKQFSLGQWFSQWKAENNGSSKVSVVVRCEGEDIAKATSTGIVFIDKKQEKETE